MLIIPDDPLIAWAMKTGYPPWIREDPPAWEDEEDDDEERNDENVFERD